MPIDAGIYGQLQPQPFNNPFKVLAEARDQQQRRELIGQQIRTGQATEEARRQDTAKQAQLEAAQQRYFSIIAASKTPDEAGERIKVEAPELYQPFLKQKTELDDKAAEIKKKGLEAAKIKAEIDKSSQEYSAPFLQMVEKSGYKPEVFDFALNTIASHFEGFPADQMRQQAGGDPDKIKALIDGFKSTAQQGADTAAARLAAEKPALDANAKIQGAVAANLSPIGLTPEQQTQQADRAAALKVSQGQLGVAQAREAREAKTAAQGDALLAPGGERGLSPSAQSGQRDDAFLATLPRATADKVRALSEGRFALPTRFAKDDRYFQGLLDATARYDPTFDTGNYNARNKARSDFTSQNGQGGKQVNGLNTAIGHLDELAKAAEALKNGNTQLYNSIANGFKTQFGWTGKTDFDTIAPKVADEVERLWRGSGGSEGSIERTLASLNSSMAPGQLSSAIGKSGALIESKLSSLEQARDQVMGPNGKDIQIIFPKSRAILDRLQGNTAGSTVATGAADLVWDPKTGTFHKPGAK